MSEKNSFRMEALSLSTDAGSTRCGTTRIPRTAAISHSGSVFKGVTLQPVDNYTDQGLLLTVGPSRLGGSIECLLESNPTDLSWIPDAIDLTSDALVDFGLIPWSETALRLF